MEDSFSHPWTSWILCDAIRHSQHASEGIYMERFLLPVRATRFDTCYVVCLIPPAYYVYAWQLISDDMLLLCGFIDDTLCHLLDTCCVICLVDIVIYSSSAEEHELHVRLLEWLRKFGLFAKISNVLLVWTQSISSVLLLARVSRWRRQNPGLSQHAYGASRSFSDFEFLPALYLKIFSHYRFTLTFDQMSCLRLEKKGERK